MTHRILVTDPLGQDGLDALVAAGVHVDVSVDLSREELVERIGGYHALVIRSGTKVDADVIGAGGALVVIGRAGVGVDNVDVDAATRHGIAVSNTPDANTNAAVEQTLALMLAAARNIAQAHASMLDGVWARSRFTGVELRGRTLGVIGFGRIGRRVAMLAQALGMEVMAYDPFIPELVARDHNTRLTELEEVLESSDVVTLHLGGGDGSPLIDAAAIEQMKPGAILVNVARGSLVDADALAAALDSGHLAAAAIDVYRSEPPGPDHPLVGHPGVVHTPHLGASTGEAQAGVSLAVARQVLVILRGEGYPNCVNVAMTDHPRSGAVLHLADRIGRVQAAMAEEPIKSVEIELRGDDVDDLVATAATGALKGILDARPELEVNYVSAPLVAADLGLAVSSAVGLSDADYPNLLSVRVQMNGHERTVSGALFGGTEPRVVRISRFQLDARPEGTVLLLLNHDVPGVVGSIGGVLGRHGVNIAEWRLGRESAGGTAISFINLDALPTADAMAELSDHPEVIKATVVDL